MATVGSVVEVEGPLANETEWAISPHFGYYRGARPCE